MKRNDTQIEQVSRWIEKMRYDDLPSQVVRLAKLQIMDCIAAVCAGYRSDVGSKIYTALKRKSSGGSYSIIPTGEYWSLDDAVYFHSSMINALEMDNFSFMGHLSQSAFSASWSVTDLTKKNGRDLLLATVIAQEVSGRLSAYMSSGPLQGHMRSFVHRIAGAVVVAKLHDCTAPVIANAIAIALSGPEFYMIPTSFSPDTKVTSTSSATLEGIRSCFLAMEGITGCLDIIEHPAGFVSTFSYLKNIPDFWKSVGQTWVMESISFKNFASCAYAQAAVEATADFISGQGKPDISEIEKVIIDCPLLTTVMESFSEPHYQSGLTQVNINFSTRRSVAATLLFGPPDGDLFGSPNLKEKFKQIEQLSSRIILKHNWQLSIAMIRGFDKCIHNPGYEGVFGMTESQKALKKTRAIYGNRSLLELKDLANLLKLTKPDLQYFLTRYINAIKGKYTHSHIKSYESDLSKLEFALGSQVNIHFKNGEIFTQACRLPKGFAGHPDKEQTVKDKFYRETIPVYGKEKAETIFGLIQHLDTNNFQELYRSTSNK